MELKLNITKQGLATTAEVINEEFTLNYGHIFRGASAYEQAVQGGYPYDAEKFKSELATINECIEVDFRAAEALLGKGSNEQFAKLFQELYNNNRKAIVVIDSANEKRVFATVGNYGNAIRGKWIRIDAFYTTEMFSLSGVQRTYIYTYSINIESDGSIVLAKSTSKRLIDEDSVADNLNTLDAQIALSANQGALLNETKVGAIEYDESTGDYVFYANSRMSRSASTEIGRIKVSDTAINVTYEELREMKNLGTLKKGAYYRITDYVTATTQSNTQSAGHPFDIIVMALDAHTLSEEAMAIQHEGDTYFANNNLAAWKVWYNFDNNTSRCLWAKKWVDEAPQKWSCLWGIIEEKLNNDVSTNYTTAVVEGKTKYLYKPASPTNYLDGKSFYERAVTGSIDSYEGLIFEADGAPYYYDDDEDPMWYWEGVGDIRVKTANGTQIATLHNDGESLFVDSRDSYYMYYIEFNPQPVEGEGEVYYYTPIYGIEEWWENVQGGSANIYENIPYTGSNDVLFYAFDSVLPKSSKMVAEVYSPETNKVYLYEGGVLDTITYTAYTAPVEGHKGVIYRLIDEFGNDCPYDFKNIQFLNGGTYFFTFSASGKDSSLLSRVCDNKIEHYSAKLLPTIFKAESKHNRIQRVDASNSREFIFEQSATYNDIRATSDEARIIAKGAFDANMILIRASLTANGAFSNNFVQYLSTTMEVNGSMYACQLDTMARNSVPLSINVGRIQQCAIYGCGTFTIANANGSVTGTMGYSTINLGMNGSNVKLLWDKTASLNSRIEGLEIKAYNWGTSEVVCDITNRPVNATYPLTIAKDSSGNVKAWCEADLVK